MEIPKVSICCSFYNRADYILDTVTSLLAQEYDNFEVIVVNDGSSDSRVREILDSFEDPRLTVVHQQNSGFVRAINLAIQKSTGELIAIQGAGDISLPNRLARQVDVLVGDPEIGAVGCKYKTVFIDFADSKERTSTPKNGKFGVEAFLEGRNPFSHGEVMFRRALFEKVGGYREYFKYAQDRDLWLRMGIHCMFYVVDDLLYERRSFYADGISADRNKLLLQQTLSILAKQCYEHRRKFGTDFVEMSGEHAGLFRIGSRELSRFMAKQAIQYIYLEKPKEAMYYSYLAYREKPTFFNLFIKGITKLCSESPRMMLGISRALKLFPHTDSWATRR